MAGAFELFQRPDQPQTAGTAFEPVPWQQQLQNYRNLEGAEGAWRSADGSPWKPSEPGAFTKAIGRALESEPGQRLMTLSMFLGPGAKTANTAALTKAQAAAAKGAPREQIWSKTGWFQGPDKKWRFEIDDSAATVSPFKMEDKLPTHLKHDALFNAYPQMRDIELYPRARGGAYGKGDEPSGTPPSIRTSGEKKIALHEAQHGVQDIEKFATGGDMVFAAFPASGKGGAWPVYRERLKAMTTPKSLEEYATAAGFDSPADAAASYKDYVKGINKSKRQGLPPNLERILQEEAGRDFYKRLAGEVESRAVEKRMNLTPEQRAARPPWLDYDVPEAQMIIK